MAYPIQLTLGTGNKVSVNYQSQEVSVSVTYQLESEDTDLLSFARDKASEVAAVHGIAWEQIKGNKMTQQAKPTKASNAAPHTTESHEETAVAEEPSLPITDGQLAALQALTTQAEWSEEQMKKASARSLRQSRVEPAFDHSGRADVTRTATRRAP